MHVVLSVLIPREVPELLLEVSPHMSPLCFLIEYLTSFLVRIIGILAGWTP